jgi:two-component system, cell cycle sensor histidine kinase and response regulator CckA
MESETDSQLHASTFEAARIQLARCNLSQVPSFVSAVHQVAEIGAHQLAVARVSIWVFIQDGKAIHCDHLYQKDGRAKSGVIFHESDFPEYFKALGYHRVVAVRDIEGEPFTREFREPYFRPLGITSMLDAPIYRNGKAIGIVCHEEVGPLRNWTPSDKDFAAAVADTLSRLYEEQDRVAAEAKIGVLENQLDKLERMSALGQLAAGIAHDFRNVLSAAIGFSELMETKVQDSSPNFKQAFEEWNSGLHQALNQGFKLTEDLLDYGLGKSQKPRVLDLNAHLQGFMPILAMALGPKVQLHTDISDLPARIFADPSQWERALLNLAFNARDAMPNGGRFAVSVQTVQTQVQGGSERSEVLVEIKDSGHGVDEATRKRMFEPYFTTKEKKGTGLGLAFVQKVVHHIGGRIEAESEVGKGFTIRLILPSIG